jgi:NADPH-dependent 2,4-dienoyl-CoA reductase/sulfur reductase-like enzyme
MPASEQFDVVVVGAGPAGIAAACTASTCGARTAILDDNPAPGGQVWRGGKRKPSTKQAARWFEALESSTVERRYSARVIGNPAPRELLVETPTGAETMEFRNLILCTGAREVFLPFPGWTLPQVMGAGGLQAMAKGGMPVAGQRIVVAGSGPLLLAVAAYLCNHGAIVPFIGEQTSFARLVRFAAGLVRHPSKILQAVALKASLLGVPLRTSCWPLAAEPADGRMAVTFQVGGRRLVETCDFLACGFGLAPNTELAQLLGCEIERGFIRVDSTQRTSVPGVYAAGEPTGIGGTDLSIVEGQNAGYAAAGSEARAHHLVKEQKKAAAFAVALERAFALREELRALPRPDTFVCRCEDVPFGAMAEYSDWRSAKLQTRCGMGPCQGRVCGPAAEFLFGWRVESVRPPLFATALRNLADE